MNFVRQLKIGPRLGLSFGLLLLLLTVLTVVSLMRLAQLSETTRDISTSLYPKSNSSQRIAYLVLDTARLTRNNLLVKDPERFAKSREAMKANRTLIDERLAVIESLVDTDTGRKTLAAMRTTIQAYLLFSDDVTALAATDKAAATDLLFGERYKTQADCLATLQSMITFQEKRMADGGVVAQAVYSNALTLIIGTALVAALLALACAWAVSRSITAPLANAVAVAESVAAGDLTSHIVVDSPDEVGRLLGALKSMNENLVSIVGSVRLTSDSIATGSSQIATGNADLSQRTEEQASNLEQTAASMEQLSSTVKSNAETARTATQLAGSATDAATRGGRIVAQVVGTMEAISASSRKIADIIGVIDGIAFQTNILALNAAVEAARAGEQGRGFAVVASEVRTLAQRSAAAAKEIKGLITDSVEKVGAGHDQVGDAGRAMDEIVAQVRRVNDLIGEIGSATQEQTQGIGQVGDAVNQLDKVTQQNAALVEESAAAAESLKHQAAKLVEAVGVFKLTTGHRIV